MRGVAGVAATASLGSVLAACGVEGTKNTGADENFDWTAWWKDQEQTDKLVFANWPLYIDSAKGKHPSIEKFTRETGIKVAYKPVIQENAEFFSQISPVLQAGDPIGYDIIVMSDGWQLTQLMENRWLTPLDHSRLPNFNKYAGEVATDLAYDPDLTYNVVWQAGVTGIAYNEDLVDGPIDSIQALFDPKYKGKVGMMSDTDELGTTGLLALGIEPVGSTLDDWQKSADLLTKQRDQGIVRQYYDSSYIKALENGDVAVSLAWSGDVFQSQQSGYSNLKFVVPEEGGLLWSDNCVLPLHAANPVSALKYLDFVYVPENQAIIEDWINYICPVPAAQPIIRNQLDDPAVANSPLVFPTPAMMERLHGYPFVETAETNKEWTDLFDPIVQS
jgi:spermidine/putrescine transport system substrate-binding protein